MSSERVECLICALVPPTTVERGVLPSVWLSRWIARFVFARKMLWSEDAEWSRELWDPRELDCEIEFGKRRLRGLSCQSRPASPQDSGAAIVLNRWRLPRGLGT